ncbi:MAG: hypothetical protein ACD_43C00018G0004 [uncultured bacterium]|nr:MAG: hypothetical protein ACD_43C00018G0004 [uncultured bacterium]
MTNIKIPRALIIITIVLGVVVLVVGGYAFGVSRRTTTNQTDTNTNNNVAKTVNTNVNTSAVINSNGNSDSNASVAVTTNKNNTNATITTVTAVVDAGVTWLTKPQPLDNLMLFADSADFGDGDTYYKVADLADGGEIIYFNRETMGTEVNRFRKDATGAYYLLVNHSEAFYSHNNEAAATLAENVQLDDTTVYQALDYPGQIAVGDIIFKQNWLPFTTELLFDEENDDPANPFAEVGETPYGMMYVDTTAIETTEANGSIEAKSYILKMADGSTVRYEVKKDFFADDNSLIAEFDDEDKDLADRTYFPGMVVGSCGNTEGDQYLVDMTAEAMTQVATTPSGDPLYTILDPESSVLLNAYETYKLGRDHDGSTTTLLSYEEFIAIRPLIIWQDKQNDYLVFMDNDYAPLVECGKPVIYLYPTETTAVGVQVGADIRISEPAYDDGWKVTAQPNGILSLTDGSTVNSLYWEGKGYGSYPRITTGRVVATQNIEQELRSDLAAQGLNNQEAADFLEFWLPRMPKTPYIRLSWLTTEQMNKLAPLSVQPNPNTVIRVFLDFSGQTTAENNLLPQQFQAIKRTGFTLVEWGGLLLGQ